MRTKIRNIFLLILSGVLLFSCTSTVNFIRPKGSVKDLNTAEDNLAPVQKPQKLENCSDCFLEFRSSIQQPNDGIKESKYWLGNMMNIEYSIYPEAVAYYSDSAGFFAISHPPDVESSDKLGFDVSGIIGGTDLFEFRYVNGRYLFQNLGKPINSLFWDSHPTTATDENCNMILIWSSDRNDKGGFASPFSSIIDNYDNTDSNTYKGNTDLFYCFKIDGIWGEVKNFNEINTESNEETPFLYCMCNNPTLLFATDRAGSYDIYKAQLTVDYTKQIITLDEKPIPLSDPGINTEYKEFFPFIPSPISEKGSENSLYFSSDRNIDAQQVSEESVLQNFGGFDIYRFNLPDGLDCKSPRITYGVVILNANNPDERAKPPYILDFNGDVEHDSKTGQELLKEGVKYKIRGGSVYDKIECKEGEDRTISHYAIREINKLDPIIIEKDSTIEYTELVEKVISSKRDTLYSKLTIHKDQLLSLPKKEGRKVDKMIIQGDSITILFIDISKDVKTEFVAVNRKKKLKVKRVIAQYDTNYIRISDQTALSEKTKRNGYLYFNNIKDDLHIRDTIYVWPQYYIYPPCEWKYEKEDIEYSKNVPYFQTCYWEVNTSENFNRQIKQIRSKKYHNASFIELHSRNQYFGYNRSNLNDEQKQFRKNKNRNRVWEYLEYAKKVSANLDKMTEEICETILPIFRDYDEHAGGTQNKLLVSIKAFSDIRPIQHGVYLGDETVDYISASYDSLTNSIINISPIHIEPDASLEDTLNDYLSKLRAYFGFKEILKRLRKNDNFAYYYDNGFVLDPTAVNSSEEFNRAFDNAKIIFLVEGKQVDNSIKAKVMGYVGKRNDYKTYDPVRRIDVNINRVEWNGVKLIKPECCKPK